VNREELANKAVLVLVIAACACIFVCVVGGVLYGLGFRF
jgi:hypothetical protein